LHYGKLHAIHQPQLLESETKGTCDQHIDLNQRHAPCVVALQRALTRPISGQPAEEVRLQARILRLAPFLLAEGHVETVARLTHPVRDPRAGYAQTLRVLEFAKQRRSDVLTKTSLMLGLGETDAEICATMDDLRSRSVDILTLGQYLRPTLNHSARANSTTKRGRRLHPAACPTQ
jgi:hypothetical protein